MYRKHVIYSAKGTPLIYVRLNKAMCGLLKSALMFYKKLVKDLERHGFKINPCPVKYILGHYVYDPVQ